MSRVQRLQTLAKLAGMAEQNGRRILGQTVAELQGVREQQQTIDGYLDEYRQRWLEQGSRGVSGAELRRGAAFQDQLGNSSELLSRRALQVGKEMDAAAARWRVARLREQNLERLAKLAGEHLARKAERRAQNELDDLIGRRDVAVNSD